MMEEVGDYNNFSNNLRVGLLGGSFDPVHHGHISIADSFLRSAYLDRLWILLTPYPPHKSGRSLASFSDRFEMLKRAFHNYSYIEISKVENQLPRPTYTFKTIRFLKQKYPEVTFYLCIGSDSLRKFHKWYKYRQILEEVDLLVARRPGEDIYEIESEIMNKAKLVAHEPVDLSSTAIRERIKNGDKPLDSIPEEVFNYIEEKNLYKE